MPIVRNQPITHALANELANISEPFIRNVLINYSNNVDNLFAPTADQVNRINLALAKRTPTTTDIANLDIDIDVWSGAANTPAPGYLAANLDVHDTAAAPLEHAQIFPLYKIKEPAVRNALMVYAITDNNFDPTEVNINLLNNEIDALAAGAALDGATLDAIVGRAFASCTSRPAGTYFATDGGMGAVPTISAQHLRIAPLLKIAEPAVRDAIITYALSAAGALFDPDEAAVMSLNEELASVPHTMLDAVFIDNAVHEAFDGYTNPPADDYFENQDGNYAVNDITAQHQRIAFLLKIAEPAVRDAIITYALSDAGLNFDPDEQTVNDLNHRIAALPAGTALDGAALNTIIDAAFNGKNTPPATPYFTAGGGTYAVAAITAQHTRIAPLLKIAQPTVRNALINFALSSAGATFAPNEKSVTDLNNKITAKAAGTLDAASLDTIVPASFNGLNPPAATYFTSDEGVYAVTAITAEHNRIAPLLKISEPAVRDAIINYSLSNAGLNFDPDEKTVNDLNHRIAALPAGTALDGAALDTIIDAAFNGKNTPPQTPYFTTDDGVYAVADITAQHTRIAPLLKIAEPAVRNALINFALSTAGATFAPDEASVIDLNNKIAAKAANTLNAAALDTIVRAAFNGLNPPGATYFATGDGDRAVPAITAEHARIAPLLKIAAPAVRDAIINYALSTAGLAFNPNEASVIDLNNQIAAWPVATPLDGGALNNIVTAFNGLPAAPAAPYFTTGGGAYAVATITAQHPRIAPLLKITEPALRDALIAYALSTAGATFKSDAATVTALNNAIASIANGAMTAASLGTAVHNVFAPFNPMPNVPPPNNLFTVGIGSIVAADIINEHNRIAALYNITEPFLRDALIAFALSEAGRTFTPNQNHVDALNAAVAAVPRSALAGPGGVPAAVAGLDGVTLDRIAQAAFPVGATHYPAVNYFQTAALNATVANIKGDHDRIAPLHNVIEVGIRNALVAYATSTTGMGFDPDETAVINLNHTLTAKGVIPDHTDLNTMVNTAFQASNTPPNNLFDNVSAANIIGTHTRIAALYKVTEPALRNALIAYAQTPGGINFDPDPTTVNNLNKAVAAVPPGPPGLDAAELDRIVPAAFTGRNGVPAGNYFQGPGPGPIHPAVANIQAVHQRIAPLYNITERALRVSLINYALATPDFGAHPTTTLQMEGRVKYLNKSLSLAPNNAPPADISQRVEKSFGAFTNPPRAAIPHAPGRDYFTTGLGRVDYTNINHDHGIAFELYKIKENALRDVLIAYALSVDFTATPDQVKNFNNELKRLATSGAPTTPLDLVQAVNNMFGLPPGKVMPNTYFDPAVPGPVGPGRVAYDQHMRIAPLYSIASEPLRESLLQYAITHQNFAQIDPEHVRQLNTRVDGLIRSNAVITATDLQSAVDAAFGAHPATGTLTAINLPQGTGGATSYFAPGQRGANALDAMLHGYDAVIRGLNDRTTNAPYADHRNDNITTILTANQDKVTAAIAAAPQGTRTTLIDNLKKASTDYQVETALKALGITNATKLEVSQLVLENRERKFKETPDTSKVKHIRGHQEKVRENIKKVYPGLLEQAYRQGELAQFSRNNVENAKRITENLITIKTDLLLFRDYIDKLETAVANALAAPAHALPPNHGWDPEFVEEVKYWVKKGGYDKTQDTEYQLAFVTGPNASPALLNDINARLAVFDTVLAPGYTPPHIAYGSGTMRPQVHVDTPVTGLTANENADDIIQRKLQSYAPQPAGGAVVAVPLAPLGVGRSRDAINHVPLGSDIITVEDDSRKTIVKRVEDPGRSVNFEIHTESEKRKELAKGSPMSRIPPVPSYEVFETYYKFISETLLPAARGVPGPFRLTLPEDKAERKKWIDSGAVDAILIYLKFQGITNVVVNAPDTRGLRSKPFEEPSDWKVRTFAEQWAKIHDNDHGCEKFSVKQAQAISEPTKQLRGP